MFYTDCVFWITIMFVAVIGFGAWVGKAWVERNKPRPEPRHKPLASIDGFELCGCGHPKAAPRSW